ncbi:MAG: hypothetical protein HYZ29_31615 [Myxococcales bacterium]|nr:hypothetical protein [Myxococcales bacterium]
MKKRAFVAMVVGSVAGLTACKREVPTPNPDRSARPAPPTPPSASSTPTEWALSNVKSEERDEAPDAPRVDGGAFKAGTLSDIGPLGPASASPFGVVMITRKDEVALAPPGKAKGSFKGIALVASSFSEKAAPPSIAGEYAYFVSNGKLARRRVPTLGPVEVLGDARDSTRVSALSATDARPALAAFIVNPDKPTGSATAMLWVEGGDLLRLSPDGTGASSVSMTESGAEVLVAVLDGRTGMTPVHVRKLTFADKRPQLGENVVAWVAGPAQPTTELTLLAPEQDAWIFSPLERETTRFGLAAVHIGRSPKMGAPVEWRSYPNGIDPAPVAATRACGRAILVYARPSTETPGAEQELHLAVSGESGLESPEVIANAPSFRGLTASGDAESVLVVYGAGSRTWALRAPCPGATKPK